MKAIIFFFAATLFLSGCCSIKPLFPKPEAQDIQFDKPPVSVINLPVSVDFSEKIPEIDQQLNTALTINDGQNDCNLTYSYAVRKTAPLNLSFLPNPGNPISLSTQLGVGAGATYCAVCVNLFGRRCIVPKVGASCGQGGESLRRVQVSLSSPLGINPDYTLRSAAQLNDLYFIDPCRVTFLNINISGIIESKARSMMPLGAINQRISSISIRDKAQLFWDKLGGKIQLDEGLFLKVHPEQLSNTAIRGEGHVAQFTVGLQASPEITNDPTVPAVSPLPNLQPVSGAAGFNIFSDIKLQYDYLSNKLTQNLKDQVITAAGKKITIKSIRTYATNNRELILQVFFKGDVCGYVYILGKPEYDPVIREIKFTRLAYDVSTNSLLLNVAAWLLQPIVLNTLEAKAKVPVGAYIDASIVTLNGYLNKEHANGIVTKGRIQSINIVPNNFQALPPFLFVRMHAIGDLEVDIKL